MWRHLELRSLGVIEHAELPLDAGFTVITGETGAGKTMVVTALGLLRGERSDAGLVRHGSDQARVEAIIDVAGRAGLAGKVDDAGGAVDDDELVIARAVSAQGRSRAYAGGTSVPAGLLTELTDELVAVHGQSDQHRLGRPAHQRAALDAFAGPAVATLLERYVPAHRRWREIDDRLQRLRSATQERARELDAAEHGLAEIDEVAPVAGEDAELEAVESRLAHAESLARAAQVAHDLLTGDVEQAVGPEGAAPLAAQAAAELDAQAAHDPELEALAVRVGELSVSLTDLAADLAGYLASVDLDPAGLATIQERRSRLGQLQRKYGPSLDEVLAWADDARRRVLDLGADDDTVAALEAERDALHAELLQLAARLTEVRTEAGARLATEVGSELEALSMKSARLVVEIGTAELGPWGADTVELLFAANSGAAPRPLTKGASGGELSRLMLSLEVVLADRSDVPTLVFDEVDAGIGGRAAVEVGRRLAVLAENAQVLAVTHLPQVAAFARHHFRVLKDDDGNVTSSSVVRLTGQDRVDELARMLAGLEDSSAAQQHARELLELAGHA
ncbi:DNA repair protein RecN [Aeromicrobium sp. Leaf350]|uniref:DNA repair protein RecN n=1 Tax=Aeromicrobium sp. Leaf350 TaxID=2876565 RepID=UPI001E359FFF|nr:DNA repair protein RecN [Aeromicrobium sp. Leaf350]